MHTIHPLPGILAVARGALVAVGSVGAALALVPGDYTVCAAVVLAFVGVFVTAGN